MPGDNKNQNCSTEQKLPLTVENEFTRLLEILRKPPTRIHFHRTKNISTPNSQSNSPLQRPAVVTREQKFFTAQEKSPVLTASNSQSRRASGSSSVNANVDSDSSSNATAANSKTQSPLHKPVVVKHFSFSPPMGSPQTAAAKADNQQLSPLALRPTVSILTDKPKGSLLKNHQNPATRPVSPSLECTTAPDWNVDELEIDTLVLPDNTASMTPIMSIL